MLQNDNQNTANDGQAIRILKDYVRKNIINKELFKSSKELINDGVYSNLSKEIISSTTENILQVLTTKKTTPKNIEPSNIEDMQFVITCTKGL